MVGRRAFVSGLAGVAGVSVLGGCRWGTDRAGPVRFGVISDTHVTGPDSVDELARAFAFLRDRGVDAVIHCGDLTDFGYIAQLESFAAAWRRTMSASVPLIPVLGNRDLTLTDKISPARRTADRELLLSSDPAAHVRRILGIDLADGLRTVTVKGVPVVCADWGREAGLETFMMRDPDLRDWTRPFVHVQHPHPGGTVGGPAANSPDPAGCWLNMFPKAVAVSGHSHRPFTDPATFLCRDYTFAAAGSHYLSDGKPQKGLREVSVLSVDGSGVRIERFGLHDHSRTVLERTFEPLPADRPVGGSFVFASWNVGGFRLGQDGASGGASAARVAVFRRTLASLDADVLALAEYDPAFRTAAGEARRLFDGYRHAVTGPRLGANGNAVLMRRFAFSSPRIVPFPVRRQPRYLVSCEADIAGCRTLIVQTHLDLDEESRKTQLKEVLSSVAGRRRVIVSGDFNVATPAEFAPFAADGFTLANHGAFGALPTHRRRRTSYTPAIDNVMTKGFDIHAAWLLDAPMILSDHRIFAVRLSPVADRDG